MEVASKMTRFNIWIITIIIVAIFIAVIASIIIRKMMLSKVRKEIDIAYAICDELKNELQTIQIGQLHKLEISDDHLQQEIDELIVKYERLNESLKLLHMLLNEIEEKAYGKNKKDIQNSYLKMQLLNDELDELDIEISNYCESVKRFKLTELSNQDKFKVKNIVSNNNVERTQENIGFKESTHDKQSSVTYDSNHDISIIQNGLRIEGNLFSDTSLVMMGSIEGEIHSLKEVEFTQSANVHGNIQAEKAIICGNIDGNIVAHQCAEIKNGASVKGNITANSLSVEDGATLEGELYIGVKA